MTVASFDTLRSSSPRTFRRIGPVSVAALSREAALARLDEAVAARRHVKVAFANAHLVNLAWADGDYAELLQDFLVLPDGIGLDIGSKLLYGEPFPANLNGTDFTPLLVSRSAAPLSVALVGARAGVAEKAASVLGRLAPGSRFEALSDGYFTPAQEEDLLARIEALRPDIILVAFGNPRQERWIAERLDGRHCSVALGVGALFDFLGGEVARAPLWVRSARLEWFWRLAQEPGRLWRRYLVGNPLFLLRLLRQRLGGAR